MKLTYWQDPGHGWIEAPRALIERLGIAHAISRFSYQDGARCYLEEDCDAPRLIEAMRRANIQLDIIEVHISGDAPIRALARFSA